MRWVLCLLRHNPGLKSMAMAAPICRPGRGWHHSGFGMYGTASVTSLATSQRQAADCNAQSEEAGPYRRELLINPDIPLDTNEDHNPVRPQPQPSLSWRAVSDLFRKEYRFRTTLALFILGMIQLCGIDGVLYV